MEASKLKVYGLGIVAANKALDSKEIEVTPIESQTMVNGELTDAATTYQSAGKDSNGSSYQTQLNATNTIKATWLPVSQPNRLTAPDVRRKEKVVLYQFADADRYYWDTLEADMTMRKLETVIWGFSATQDEGADPSEDNTYILEVSSHKKIMRVHTSQGNGEPAGYDIMINMADAYFSFIDTEGNSIVVDSMAKQIHIENGDGSFLDLLGKVFTGSAEEAWNIKTKSWNVEYEQGSLQGQMLLMKSLTTHDGDFNLGGDLGMAPGTNGSGGNAQLRGQLTAKQGLVSEADIQASGTMHALKVISDQPIQAPNVP